MLNNSNVKDHIKCHKFKQHHKPPTPKPHSQKSSCALIGIKAHARYLTGVRPEKCPLSFVVDQKSGIFLATLRTSSKTQANKNPNLTHIKPGFPQSIPPIHTHIIAHWQVSHDPRQKDIAL